MVMDMIKCSSTRVRYVRCKICLVRSACVGHACVVFASRSTATHAVAQKCTRYGNTEYSDHAAAEEAKKYLEATDGVDCSSSLLLTHYM